MTGSGRKPDERLELPFDQYQRYAVTAEILRGLGVPAGSRLLEVGGAPGPLETFLPEYTLVVSDVEGAQDGRFLLADGAALPFPDSTFPGVIALDVLEHVPPGSRVPFLSEARRVSADLVVLSAPFADPELELAEEALNEFVRARFQGDFPTLDEHATNGLPELDATVAELAQDGWEVTVLPSGYLPRWLAGMLMHHELLASGLPHLGKLHAYYNQTVSPLDCREPAYRHVLIASRGRRAGEIDAVVDPLRSEGDAAQGSAALSAIASSVFAQRLDAVALSGQEHRELDQARSRIGDLERVVADREARINDLTRLVDDLKTERDDAILGERDARSRAWLFGIPFAAQRIRSKVSGKGAPS